MVENILQTIIKLSQSPFNVGLPIDLAELSLAQTQDLAGFQRGDNPAGAQTASRQGQRYDAFRRSRGPACITCNSRCADGHHTYSGSHTD